MSELIKRICLACEGEWSHGDPCCHSPYLLRDMIRDKEHSRKEEKRLLSKINLMQKMIDELEVAIKVSEISNVMKVLINEEIRPLKQKLKELE